jgi:hypothetical protein
LSCDSMDPLVDYDDPMDTTDDSTAGAPKEPNETALAVDSFRRKSLFFAAFPWFTPFLVIRSTLVEAIGARDENHYAYVRFLFNTSIAEFIKFMFSMLCCFFFCTESSIWLILSTNTTLSLNRRIIITHL